MASKVCAFVWCMCTEKLTKTAFDFLWAEKQSAVEKRKNDSPPPAYRTDQSATFKHAKPDYVTEQHT